MNTWAYLARHEALAAAKVSIADLEQRIDDAQAARTEHQAAHDALIAARESILDREAAGLEVDEELLSNRRALIEARVLLEESDGLLRKLGQRLAAAQAEQRRATRQARSEAAEHLKADIDQRSPEILAALVAALEPVAALNDQLAVWFSLISDPTGESTQPGTYGHNAMQRAIGGYISTALSRARISIPDGRVIEVRGGSNPLLDGGRLDPSLVSNVDIDDQQDATYDSDDEVSEQARRLAAEMGEWQ